MSLIVEEPHTLVVRQPVERPETEAATDEPRLFDCADEDSKALLVAGAASIVVWLLVGVSVWRRVARRRATAA